MVESPHLAGLRSGSLAALLILSGCAVELESGWESGLERAIADRADCFAVGERILSGFVPLAPGTALAAGDEVLFGVCLEVGDHRTIWHLDVRVVGVETKRWLDFRPVQDFEQRVQPDARRRRDIEAARVEARTTREQGRFDFTDLASQIPVARIRVEAFDAEGRSLDVGESEAVEWRLRQGLFPACVVGHRLRAVMGGRVALGLDAEVIELGGEDYDDLYVVGNGVASCEQFFRILRTNPVTRRILYEVIALPTIWSMILRLGVRAAFSIDFFAARRVEAARRMARPVASSASSVDIPRTPTGVCSCSCSQAAGTETPAHRWPRARSGELVVSCQSTERQPGARQGRSISPRSADDAKPRSCRA